jgi:cell division protein ZapA (FtsZ GTPase activity inhibitor)
VVKKVEVTILSQPFTFVGEDEEKIRNAARFVDERIQQVVSSYGIVNTMNAVIMAMMVVADEYLEMRRQAKNLESKTLRLLEKVENFENPCGVRDKW